MSTSNNKIILSFINSINLKLINNISELITMDHIFIDSHGNKLQGKEDITKAWKEYFKMFPDYKIEITDIFGNENTFVILGNAGGTYQSNTKLLKKNEWKIPAAWKAVLSGDKISLWQVYADTKIVSDIIEQNK